MPDTITLFGTEIAGGADLYLLWSVVFVAGILRGFTGFGSALLIVPVLSFLYGPASAVVIETPVVLYLLPTAIRQSDHKTTLPMLAMFILFVPVGAMLLSLINPEPMKVALLIFVLLMLTILTRQSRLAAFLNPKTMLAAGALAGTSQGLTAIASPIFATAAIAFPALILGVWLGSRLFARYAHLNLRPNFLTLIALTSLATLIKAHT